MELFGYDDYFREMVMLCVWTASFSALIKGSLSLIFQAQHRIRQGDPMSRLHFVMVVEYLARLTRKAVEDRQLEDYRIGGVQVGSTSGGTTRLR